MNLNALPVFDDLAGALRFQSARLRVLAENVSNVDTPGFTPRDILGGDAGEALGRAAEPGAGPTALARTDPRHLAVIETASSWRPKDAPDTELTVDGNSVVIEEQIARVSETRGAYELALSLYQKNINLLRQAGQAPTG